MVVCAAVGAVIDQEEHVALAEPVVAALEAAEPGRVGVGVVHIVFEVEGLFVVVTHAYREGHALERCVSSLPGVTATVEPVLSISVQMSSHCVSVTGAAKDRTSPAPASSAAAR